jgi:hypothetical protein
VYEDIVAKLSARGDHVGEGESHIAVIGQSDKCAAASEVSATLNDGMS